MKLFQICSLKIESKCTAMKRIFFHEIGQNIVISVELLLQTTEQWQGHNAVLIWMMDHDSLLDDDI